MADKADITPELLRQLLHYEPETGKLFWKKRPREMFGTKRARSVWNGRYAGKEAFTTVDAFGYLQGRILNQTNRAHRVIWMMVRGEWPEVIDHINGNPADNRIENLRNVSQSVNCRNVAKSRLNTSGRTGITKTRNGRWSVTIGSHGEMKYIGNFIDFDDACAARASAEADLGYHKNHGR